VNTNNLAVECGWNWPFSVEMDDSERSSQKAMWICAQSQDGWRPAATYKQLTPCDESPRNPSKARWRSPMARSPSVWVTASISQGVRELFGPTRAEREHWTWTVDGDTNRVESLYRIACLHSGMVKPNRVRAMAKSKP
jgi:hypothetical protein